MRILYQALVILIVISCQAQTNNNHLVDEDYYENCRRVVLNESDVGKEYFFKRKGTTIDEVKITFLGTVLNQKGELYKIINSVNYVGYFEETVKGSGCVFIYTEKNNRIGCYYIDSPWGLPSKIINDCLIFSYDNDFCNQSTKVCLRDSIPKQIFISCTIEGGDLYNFEFD